VSAPLSPADALKSRKYLGLLVISAALGVPISAAAYGFLKLIEEVNEWAFTDLPGDLGFDAVPTWWPLMPLGVAGLLVGLIVRYLPGRGGEVPVHGFHAGGVVLPRNLAGIALASLVSIGLGAVIGPEGPLVALGGGLAYLAIWVAKRDVPAQTGMMLAAAGSFAAISTLLGSPLSGAVFLLEASGLGGLTASVVLVPGLLGAGVGALIFTGLDSWTGFGTFTLAITDLPPVTRPDVAEFAWALGIGLAAAPACWLLRKLAHRLEQHVNRRVVLLPTLVGLGTALLAILYDQRTGHSAADVLFSGQAALPGLVDSSATYSVGALLLLMLCKGLAYMGGLSSFRGGPTFPAVFLGAAAGIALSHLPGLDPVPGAAMGLAAMTVGMLRVPIATVLLTVVIFGSAGITLMPVVIVAVVVSYVATERLPDPVPPAAEPPAPVDPPVAVQAT
jgi:H+/Cl- antiporter ClcA